MMVSFIDAEIDRRLADGMNLHDAVLDVVAQVENDPQYLPEYWWCEPLCRAATIPNEGVF